MPAGDKDPVRFVFSNSDMAAGVSDPAPVRGAVVLAFRLERVLLDLARFALRSNSDWAF
jgi:hypothetical protein